MEVLTVANARDQRVIPGMARQVLKSAAPALQAIGTVAATELLKVALARDQRVIPSKTKKRITRIHLKRKMIICGVTING